MRPTACGDTNTRRLRGAHGLHAAHPTTAPTNGRMNDVAAASLPTRGSAHNDMQRRGAYTASQPTCGSAYNDTNRRMLTTAMPANPPTKRSTYTMPTALHSLHAAQRTATSTSNSTVSTGLHRLHAAQPKATPVRRPAASQPTRGSAYKDVYK